MKKTNQSRMADNYTSMSWGRGDKLYASDLTKMSRQVDSNENELVDLTTTTIPKIVSDVASNKSTLDEFAPKVAKIDVPEGSTIVKEIDKAVADLVNGAPETLDTIKEVADAIEQNGDAIDALNDIVTKNKVAIDSVDAEQKATAEKLATLDSKAVKYQEFGENRKTIQLANYDTISGVTTKGLGVNLAMVSKWDKADFGSAQIETNLNAKDGIVTINDTETVATVKQVGEAAGQLNTKFEGKLETVNSAIDSLGVRIDNAKEQLNASIESVKSYADEQLATKQPVGDYPEFQKFSAGVDPAERKTIQLANADSISGVTTDGRGVNVAMVSKWNKVDLGSSQVSMNLNSLDGQVTINGGKVVATLDDISGSETATNALIDKKIADYHKESDAKFVSAKTTGRHSTVAVSTADDEVRLSSSETNPTGSQGGVYVGSQLIQVMTNYKPSDRKEASLLMITPSRFDLKRRDAEGQMHEIELVDLITKANKVPGVEAGVEAVKKRVETLSGEVNTKTPLESFEAFKTETNGEIQKVKSNVLQLSNSVYTKSEIDGKLTGAFHYKGSVETYAELPKEDLQVGDVWNVVQPDADHHINAGDNVAWNGSGWDALCGVVDLSGYDTIDQVAQKIADAVAPKADKTSVDAELSKKATIEALNEHCGSFDQFKTKNQQALDTKADQDFVVQQLASKVNAEQHEADKKALEAEINKRVDKETYKTDKGVIVSELNNKVSTANFEAAKKEIEVALDAKQPAGSYVNKPEFDQFVVQYGKDKGTFALTAVVDEKLAVKADKTYVNLELAKKAEKIHSHVIADTEGLVDALAAKVEKETYIADKATFAIKTEVNEALAVKADNEAVKQLKETKVEKNVYDAHVEATTKTLAEKLDKTTHEAYTNTVTHALGEKLDQSIYQADKPTFALKTDLTPLATKAEVEEKLAGAVASVYRYKGSVATEDELPKEQNVVGDVWNVDADGANVAWDGEKWDKLGGPIDLSAYATIESVDGKVAQAKSELQPKIDANKDEIVRVEGKVDSHDAVFTKYQQTVDGKFAQEVVDRDAAIKVETDARVAAITQEVKDREAAIEGEKTAREAAVADVAGKLTTHEQAFEAFKTANTEAITAECAKVTAAFQAADEAEKAAREQAVQKVAGDLTTHSEANTAEFAKVRGEFAAADTQLQEQLNVKIDAKLAAADFDSFKTGQYKTDVDALKQADADEAQARQTLDTKFETFKTETYEPKVAELTKSIGDETSARQDAIIETKNAFKAADEKVTGEYTKAIEAAKTEVTTKVTEVEGALNAYKGSNDAAVAKVKTDVTEAFGAADQALETKVTQGYTAAVEGEKAAREAAVALLATKVELEGVNATLTGKFGDYYTKGEVDGKLASIYRFKGSVAAEDQLPTQDQVIGDVYNVEDTGMNVAWDGKKWDKLGSVINLTPYATTEAVEAKITETKQAASEALNQHAQTAETTYAKKAEVTKQIEAVDGKFAGKADKVHTHTIENITGLQDALDGKQAVGDYALKSEVKTVDDKFAGYTTTEALNGLLDGKAAVVHTHTVDNVTGLQAALDAKMAASEAAKFATHDHNHDQAYLAIKGKAESAKVADSVAWANVTGTETIAVKSEVEAVDAKFASYTTTAALAAEYATKQALADGLKAKAEAAHTHVAADITDLQDKLDAKLDVGGKAESAKVADSVAWTSVTGTEGVALKSDLDSKMEASEASKFAQASHVHAIENVTGLQQALNDKIAVADADGKYALKSAITGLATKEELNGKAAASHTHQEGEVEGLTAKLATFALKSEIAGFVTDEALKRDYTNTADLGQLLDSKLDTTAGDKKYATKTELNGYQPKGDYVAKTEVNSIVEAAVKAPVFVNIPLRPEPNYTEAAIANWFGCETIEQVGQVITGDKVVYLHFTSTGKDYKIPVQYCAFKADGFNDIILMTVGLDTANDEVCKYKITIALNSDSSTVDVNKTPLVSPAA